MSPENTCKELIKHAFGLKVPADSPFDHRWLPRRHGLGEVVAFRCPLFQRDVGADILPDNTPDAQAVASPDTNKSDL